MVRSGAASACGPSSACWLSTLRSGAPSSSSNTCSKRVNRVSARQLQSVPQSSPRPSGRISCRFADSASAFHRQGWKLRQDFWHLSESKHETESLSPQLTQRIVPLGRESMRIALVAPPFISVPPKVYGGTELFLAQLAEGLQKLGVEVVVYCNGESTVNVEKRWIYQKAQWPIKGEVYDNLKDINHTAWAVADAAESCDVIHLNNVPGLAHSRFV